MVRRWLARLGLVGTCACALACSDDASLDAGETSAGSETGASSSGDPSTGDGDPSTGDGDPSTGDGDPSTGDGDPSTGDGDPSTGDGDGDPSTGDGDGDPPLPRLPLCGTPAPDGAELAPPLPTYAGTCPVLVTGEQLEISTSGGDRSFIFVAPTDAGDDEILPVMFMFHWLGASASSFYDRAEVQAAADHYRFIALIPNGRDIDQLVPFKWPFAVSDLDFLMNQDFDLFDDLLACTAEQYAVDKECVSAMGVSAGAMFASMLANIAPATAWPASSRSRAASGAWSSRGRPAAT